MKLRFLRLLLERALLMSLLWIVVAGLSARTWPLAASIVLVSAWASLRTVPPGSFHLTVRGLSRFLPFFLLYSVRGGVDVALRAVRRTPGLDPGEIELLTVLPPGAARSFFIAVIGLLPGTLTARVEDDRLRVHVLDRRAVTTAQLRSLETRVAGLFGIGR